MSLSLIAVAVVPALLLTALMLWALCRVISKIARRQPVGLIECLAVVVWLLALDSAVFLFQVVSAGLSHSSAAARRLPLLGVLSFLLIVVLPALLLLALALWSKRRGGP